MSDGCRLSVIVPVYNDPDGVRETLRSLTDQVGPPTYEVVVIDNNSTDETPDVIEEFEQDHPNRIFGYSETEIQSSYAARNTGIEQASGEILAFIDADVTVSETWAADIQDRFQSSAADYLGCNVEMYIPDGEETIWGRYDVAVGLSVKHYLETKQFAPTCALAVRNEVIDEVGGFDQTLVSGGDKEFGKRVHTSGFQMEYADDIVVRHPARTTLRAHLQKSTRIGEGQAQLWTRYDLAVHPLSFTRFLPPSPQRIKNRTGRSRFPLLIYSISYALKLVQTTGSIREYYSQFRNS